MNPGYNQFGRHPWEDIFVITAEDEVICGPCLPDHIDPADVGVEVWAFASEGWLNPVVCTRCGLSIPVYVNGEQNGPGEEVGDDVAQLG